jgi:hypothetical protein
MKLVVTIKTVTGRGHEQIIAQEWTDIGLPPENIELMAQALAHEICQDLSSQPSPRSRE